ncbi:MAG: hypothetical protein WD317_09815 [Balneolaceae bacterium]
MLALAEWMGGIISFLFLISPGSLSDLGTESEQDEILAQWNTTFEVRSGVTERESGIPMCKKIACAAL